MRSICAFLLAASIVTLLSCGGSGTGTPAPGDGGTLKPNFAVSVTPGSTTMLVGTSASFHLSLTPIANFSGTATVTITGVPDGVTVTSPQPITLGTSGADVTLAAAASANVSSARVVFEADSGGVKRAATLIVSTASNLAPLGVEVSPKTLSVYPGQATSFYVRPSPGAGADNYTIQLTPPATLPVGVTLTLEKTTLGPRDVTTGTLSASSEAPPKLAFATSFSAHRDLDGAQTAAGFSVSVQPKQGTLPRSRTSFVPTYNRFWGPDNGGDAVYDAARQRVYVSNPRQSEIEVFSAVDRTIVARVPVQRPSSHIAISRDGRQLVVSTLTEFVLAIDLDTLQIAWRAAVPVIAEYTDGNGHLAPRRVHELANGNYVFSDYWTHSFFVWNKDTGAMSRHSGNPVQGHIEDYWWSAVSYDHTRVVFASNLSGAPGQKVEVYDSTTEALHMRDFGDWIYEIWANPAKPQFVLANSIGARIVDYDLNDVCEADGLGGSGVAFSPDGTLMYGVASTTVAPVLLTYSTSDCQLVHIAPAMNFIPPYYEATEVPRSLVGLPDSMVVGVVHHGIVFEDAAADVNLLASPYAYRPGAYSWFRAPLNKTSNEIFFHGQGERPGTEGLGLPDVWFGNQQSTNVIQDLFGVKATAPASSVAGPVDVLSIMPTGQVGWNLQAFSYGVDLRGLIGTMGGPDGGYSVNLFGYGIANPDLSPGTASFGASSGTVMSANRYAPDQYPFHLDLATVTVPAGAPSSTVDVSYTSAQGTATLSRAFRYVAAQKSYALPESATAVLYDRTRNRLYLAGSANIHVFSVADRSFLSPISIPTVNGGRSIAMMAMTPGDQLLAVANSADGSVGLINPDNPSDARAVAITAAPGPGVDRVVGVAATSTGKLFIGHGNDPNETCGGRYDILDLATLGVTSGATPEWTLYTCWETVSNSRDGSRVFVANMDSSAGPVALWNAETNTWSQNRVTIYLEVGAFLPNAVSAPDGNVFAAQGRGAMYQLFHTFTPALSESGAIQVPDVDSNDMYKSHYDAVLHETGALVYSAMDHSIDIFDIHSDRTRERIALKETVAPLRRGMAINEAGDRIFVLTDAGLTVIDTGYVPVSIGHVVPERATPSQAITIRGSGFAPGATVTIGGATVPAIVIDADTINTIAPSGCHGPQTIVVKSDGGTYSHNTAFSCE